MPFPSSTINNQLTTPFYLKKVFSIAFASANPGAPHTGNVKRR